MSSTAESMPEVPASAGAPERSYWALVRLLAEGRQSVEVDLVQRVLRCTGRTRFALETDIDSARERRRLLAASAAVLDLEVSCDLAEEGYRLLREAARKAREDAEAREAKAQHIWQTLRHRLIGACEAEGRLQELLPPELAVLLRARRDHLREVKTQLESARSRRRCVEHLEAAQEQAELAWREVRAAIW